MIINNKSIQGVFIYAETAEYERGDFIVDEDSIYICTPKEGDTVSGKKPKNDSENYKLYLGRDIATWEDFESQYSSQNNVISGEDKLITSTVLSQILKKLSFGLDSNGIITESTVPLSPNLKNILSSTGLSSTNQQDIVDHLLLTENVPEYNNMTIRVGRNLFKDILPNIDDLATEFFDDIEINSVILKQYTYYETTSYTSKNPDNKIRVQEVIDHINGVCLYRFTRFGAEVAIADISEGKIGIPSSWKLSCPNLQYLSKLNSLLKYIENSKDNKSSNFRFKEITNLLNGPEIENQKCSYTLQIGFNLKNEELKLTTVVISVVKNNIYYNYSLTINLSDPKSGKIYAFPNEVKITRKDNIISLNWEDLNIDSVNISNIYVKSYEN